MKRKSPTVFRPRTGTSHTATKAQKVGPTTLARFATAAGKDHEGETRDLIHEARGQRMFRSPVSESHYQEMSE